MGVDKWPRRMPIKISLHPNPLGRRAKPSETDTPGHQRTTINENVPTKQRARVLLEKGEDVA